MKLVPACAAAAVLNCASAPVRDPAGCAAPAERAEVQQIQIGWNRLDPGIRPPVYDPARPSRDPRQAETLANELYAQCKKGVPMEPLQDKYSEAPGGTIVVGPQARLPYKASALCLQKNDCAVVRGSAAFHVLKRID